MRTQTKPTGSTNAGSVGIESTLATKPAVPDQIALLRHASHAKQRAESSLFGRVTPPISAAA